MGQEAKRTTEHDEVILDEWISFQVRFDCTQKQRVLDAVVLFIIIILTTQNACGLTPLTQIQEP